MADKQIAWNDDFLCILRAQLGETEFAAYLAAMEESHTRGLRVNLLRYKEGRLCNDLEGLDGEIPWAMGGYFVDETARPGLSPLHEGGAFYLQEPSAMTAAAVLGARPGEKVLDLCAAPGGKSTQIAAMMQGEGVLVCNEPVPSRAQILSRNVERMGVKNAVVVSAMPDVLAPRFLGFFDRILVDAPCSGEGMFRRQPEARLEWNAQSPALCAERQLLILREAARMLRAGGRMVYSTCTFNQVENEGVLRSFLAERPDFQMEAFTLGTLGEAQGGFMHLYPHRMRGEGHFISCLKRSGESTEIPEKIPSKSRKRNTRPTGRPKREEDWQGPLDDCLKDVLSPGVSFHHIQPMGDALYALPQGLPPLDGLRVIRSGLLLAHVARNRCEPDHALAMALKPHEAARTVSLTRDQALAYQSGEVIPAPADLAKGYALMTLEGCPLGWAKCSDGQLKNHYPKGLRR